MEKLSVCIGDCAFSAGSNVSGHVALFQKATTKINKIDLSFTGKAYIFVPEYQQELMKEQCSHPDSDQEQIIDLNITLWNGCIHAPLEAGIHKFPFCIELPESLPSSFQLHSKDLHGCYIAYTLKASVICPNKKSYRAEVPVVITNELNIHDSSFSSMQCVSGKKSKSGILRYLPTNGRVGMEVTTDRSGYCAGDSIAITADVKNSTKAKITSLQAILVRKIMHKDHYHENYCSVVKKTVNDGSHTNMLFVIPQTSPSIINCNILKVTYELKVKLKMANGIKVVALLPITIGSASLDEYVHKTSQCAELPENQLSRSSSIQSLSSDILHDCLMLNYVVAS